jgi:hypothetical protein
VYFLMAAVDNPDVPPARAENGGTSFDELAQDARINTLEDARMTLRLGVHRTASVDRRRRVVLSVVGWVILTACGPNGPPAAPLTDVPVGTNEPTFDAATATMVYQDNMDQYTDLAAMGASTQSTPRIVPEDSPAYNGHSVDPSLNKIVAGRSGNALRMAYSGRNQDGASFMTINMPSTPINSTNYFSYYARVTFSQPLQSQFAVKWFMIWHWNDSNTRTQFNTHDHLPCPSAQHDTYWQVWDQAETRCQGNQPIGPHFEDIVNDNKWHRFTYAFRPNTSKGSRDGFARMWVDGQKIIDVSAATVGVTPSGGEKPWCDWDDVDNLVANDRAAFMWWGGVQTSYETAPWTYDIDDFSWWIAK